MQFPPLEESFYHPSMHKAPQAVGMAAKAAAGRVAPVGAEGPKDRAAKEEEARAAGGEAVREVVAREEEAREEEAREEEAREEKAREGMEC
jgi:hypothetical protein